jgi:glyoxylase-like metal-dependent hydrolase (beta-lactamase superfamily II)
MAEVVSQGSVTVLDLHFQAAGTVGAFLIRTAEGPVLVETGPESLFSTLEAAVNGQGFALDDIRHVFITHIHLALQAIHTPGHAIHHITYRLDDGLFTGDVGGIRIGQGPVIPPFSAPDIDLEAWADSLARLRAVAPTTIYPTHFGIKGDGAFHLDSLEENLQKIAK